MNELKETFNLFPWYVYAVMMAASLLLGIGIRKRGERRRLLREKQAKLDRKEAKKEAKRQARLRKKNLNREQQ